MSRGEFLFPIEKENKGEQCRKWSHYLTKLFSCLCKLRLDEKRTHAHPSLSSKKLSSEKINCFLIKKPIK